MKKVMLLLLLLLGGYSTHLSAQEDSITISLITYSPEPAIYSAFGHSAIRVQQHAKGRDDNYNYGIFDFDEPNFVWKFLRGKLLYQLGRNAFPYEKAYYQNKGKRQLIEQEFLLTASEKQAVIAYLENNYRIENRSYYYDFFYDNCSTRIRDIMADVLGDNMQYVPHKTADLSFRQLLDVHLANRQWDDFGMDILLGMPADQIASYANQMYLPYFLSENLEQGVVVLRNDSIGAEPLLAAPQTIVNGKGYEDSPSFPRPLYTFAALFLLLLFLSIIGKRASFLYKIDAFLFFLLGIIGVFLLFMWLGTDHIATRWNLNILWANPLYLLFFIGVAQQKTTAMQWAYGIAICGAILTALVALLAWQQFHIGIIPLLCMMPMRALWVYFSVEP